MRTGKPVSSETIERAFDLDKDELGRIVRLFRREMGRGLSGKPGSLKMIPAYVARPTGRERGTYLALDLGGTNFRVLEVELRGKRICRPPRAMKFTLPQRAITGTGDELFGFIASSIRTFLRKYPVPGDSPVPLGFTFSFPVDQTGIASGKLICWTKGFRAKGVVGSDVITALRRALGARGLGRIDVVALANDTVGALVAHSYVERSCDAGVIIGTGTNACYPERTAAITKWKHRRGAQAETIVNIEWGNFNKFPRTVFDRDLDRRSSNPGRQLLEKAVSGMYLGEVARLAIVSLGGRIRAAFARPGSLTAADMSSIESGKAGSLAQAARHLRRRGVGDPTRDERAAVERVCRAVSRRAARIAAAAIMAVVTRMDPRLDRRHVIAIDGSVYEKHPAFAPAMVEAFGELAGGRASRLCLALAKDGSGKGAAIIAAVAYAGTDTAGRR